MRLQQFAPLAGLAATIKTGHAKELTGFGTGMGAVGPISTDWVTSVVRKLTLDVSPSPSLHKAITGLETDVIQHPTPSTAPVLPPGPT